MSLISRVNKRQEAINNIDTEKRGIKVECKALKYFIFFHPKRKPFIIYLKVLFLVLLASKNILHFISIPSHFTQKSVKNWKMSEKQKSKIFLSSLFVLKNFLLLRLWMLLNCVRRQYKDEWRVSMPLAMNGWSIFRNSSIM